MITSPSSQDIYERLDVHEKQGITLNHGIPKTSRQTRQQSIIQEYPGLLDNNIIQVCQGGSSITNTLDMKDPPGLLDDTI